MSFQLTKEGFTVELSGSQFPSCCGIYILHGIHTMDDSYDYKKIHIVEREKLYEAILELGKWYTTMNGGTKLLVADKDRTYEGNRETDLDGYADYERFKEKYDFPNFHEFALHCGFTISESTTNFNEGTRDFVAELNIDDSVGGYLMSYPNMNGWKLKYSHSHWFTNLPEIKTEDDSNTPSEPSFTDIPITSVEEVRVAIDNLRSRYL